MKITMTPPLRNAFDMARTCETYKARLMDLFGSEARIQQADLDWQRTKPPIHHFTTYCTIARIEALVDYLPSERKLISFLHHYNIGEK
jgi:hypothetical protein